MENPLARALVGGEFRPGDRIVADAGVASGAIVFTSDGATVVGDGQRRDARARSEADAVGAAAGGARGQSPLDLPPTRRPRDDGDELVN